MKITKRFRQVVVVCLAIFCSTLLAVNLDLQTESQGERLFDPAPKDESGRFENLSPDLDRGSSAVHIGFFLRRFATIFRGNQGAPESVPNEGSFLRSNKSIPTVTWVGHATLLMQMQGVNFLTDPIWSNTPSPVPMIGPSRFVAPGLKIEDLPVIDFVVISHNHYDHLDLPTLIQLARKNSDTVFFVPLGNGEVLRNQGINNVQELNWGDRVRYKELVVHCLPNQHWSKRSLTDTRKALWSSWAVIGADKRFYFAGDTGYFDGFKDIGNKLGPFDLAAVPIGAYEPNVMMKPTHMNPEEAIQAALDVQANTAVAIHFGTFDLSDEPLEEPPQRFKVAADATALAKDNSWVLKIGETREF
ncbi:MAG: MBL fold metallo-hydrolase [Porticoccaceae bacterium]|jgi:N-acyl-phosphatidylethanolamine-hydrolysing phospholipase D|nr:MBL fold metallo-hydrolase [Porticoccaceae bacterium]MBT5577776.1 MBL fold metallo-hydrolase [Porticoccaceae bacterium]MBT7375453.1 MBL fold metallo-hydrolase [Porticoccaceae bacterium]